MVVPGGGKIIAEGFDGLGHAPEWFQAAVAASVAFAFGSRGVRGAQRLFLQLKPR